MVTVLTIIVVAFMTSMSIERKTSQSYANIERARLAAEAGVEEVINIIGNSTDTDDFIVLKTTASLSGISFPVTLIGEPSATSATATYYPLFSGGQVIPDVPVESMPAASGMFDPSLISDPEDIAVNEPRLPPSILGSSPSESRTAWKVLQSQGGDTIRYSYWAEDLEGYLDPEVVGSISTSRTDGRDPAELGIFTLFRPDEKINSEPESGIDQKLITSRTIPAANGPLSTLHSSKTIAQLGVTDGFDENGQYNPSQDYDRFFAGNRRAYDEGEIIPRGFGYRDAGNPKQNLNTLISQPDAVTQIADWIDGNMPQFADRAGSFPSTQDYTKTIAANIVDYVDEDNNATVGSDYRGVDSYPFLTQFYQQYTWINPNSIAANPWVSREGTWQARISLTLHAQLWNPSNKVIDSGTYRIDLTPTPLTNSSARIGNRYAAFQSGSEIFKFHELPPGTPSDVFSISFSPANAIQPNQYYVWSSPPVEWWLDTGISSTQPAPTYGTSNPGAAARPRISLEGGSPSQDSFEHGYRSFWNNQLVDQPGAITHDDFGTASVRVMEGNHGVLDRSPGNGGNGPSWRGGQPGLRHGSSTEPRFLLGDPRGTFYIRDYVAAHDYDQNASWWGRHKISSNSNSPILNSFIAEARTRAWPDGAHDAPIGFSVVDSASGNGAQQTRDRNMFVPANVSPRPAIDSTKAPSKISNEGQFESILELGNIYDPLNWRPNFEDVSPQSFEAYEDAWRKLGEKEDSMVADANYTAPSTLSVGRSEYFDFTLGKKAHQLLDLFSLSTTRSASGRININTASRDVLRTLGAGIAIASDPAIEPANLRFNAANPLNALFGPFVEKQADKLADAIIQSRPFFSTSQLSDIKLNDQPLFGSLDQWSTGGPTRWNDSAAEEYFSKMFHLTTVRGRHFRIHVTGQVLNSDGKVVATSRKVYEVFSEPIRDSSGIITSQQVTKIYETQL